MKNLIFFLLACYSFAGFAQKRTVDLPPFSKISLDISGKLILNQGPEISVEVQCSDEVFDKLEFEVRGGKLRIKTDNWTTNFRGNDLVIYVSMPTIESIGVGGSGDIEVENTVHAENLNVSVSGSGKIKADVTGDDIEVNISGSGSIILSGQMEDAEVRISGSGNIKAKDLTVENVGVHISGSGSCYVRAENSVKARISGSGNVHVSGDPTNVDCHSSGSGRVKRV